MRTEGKLPKESRLLEDLRRRIAFETYTEFGHQARIGRSLSRTGSATVGLSPALREAALDRLLPRLQESVGGLRSLDRATLRRLLLGGLHRLRERGAILHEELPTAYLTSAGANTFRFKALRHLPDYGPGSRLPALLLDGGPSDRFVPLARRGEGSWLQRWSDRVLDALGGLRGDAAEVWREILPVLTELQLTARTETKVGPAWGLRPEALRITTAVRGLRCDRCGLWQAVAEEEAAHWEGIPCHNPHCDGHYGAGELPEAAYFGDLYRSGTVERVFAAEHTGLLTREVREETEQRFKEDENRQPWDPNLLLCTPTLEMGIDIGELSVVMLASMPPTQANYLQRVGRAGRRNGSSLVLTVARGRPHDLYFYAEPLNMLDGEVRPPGVFLDASAVLERQLAAFTLDRWAQEGGAGRALSSSLGKVLDRLETSPSDRFPWSWFRFLDEQGTRLLEGFLALFGEALGEDSRTHLSHTISKQGVALKVSAALHAEARHRASLRRRLALVNEQRSAMEDKPDKDRDHQDQLKELDHEAGALKGLLRAIDREQVIAFLTTQGLLPNYAFPEAPIRLRSVIWKKGKDDKFSYREYEYARPAGAALSELAPEQTFYAEGHQVSIDQVDVGAADGIESWRFCPDCTYSQREDPAQALTACPACGSEGWAEAAQRRNLLHLSQVFARTSAKKARIHDEHDERQPRHYNRHMLMSFRKEEQGGAWRLSADDFPFAFEYLRRATFREINFGLPTDVGEKFSVAGREGVRSGFTICRSCGMVQTEKDKTARHSPWCPEKGKVEALQHAVYLYREFDSEAIRLLLPIEELGTQEQLHSFLAAFQLGLREQYGGQVDHIASMVYSEPEEDIALRRQYLVLYDKVPGGTGYLKDLAGVREEAVLSGAQHPIFGIIQAALTAMTTCSCFGDPDRDGCYACLYAYRNAREQADTSAAVAVEQFQKIYDRREQLVPIEGLSQVSVSGLMDSVLERRFIDVLPKVKVPGVKVTLAKEMVGSQQGYRLEVGDRTWRIELQRRLGPPDGVAVPLEVDFLFHPSAEDELPIAVFTDGYAFHRDRIGHDMAQRKALLMTGRYDVWSFTWQDVQEAYGERVSTPEVELLDLARVEGTIRKMAPDLIPSLWALQAPAVMAFVRGLHTPVPWDRLAALTLGSQLGRSPLPAGSWTARYGGALPAALRCLVESQEAPEHLYQLTEGEISILAGTSLLSLRESSVEGWQGVVQLDESEKTRDADDFVHSWRGYLKLFRWLRRAPGLWFLTPSTPVEDLRALSERACPELDDRWEEVRAEITPIFEALVSTLEAHPGCRYRPRVGIEITDQRGHVWEEGELVWEALRVAVIEALPDGTGVTPPADWLVFTRQALESDPGPLLTALTERGDT